MPAIVADGKALAAEIRGLVADRIVARPAASVPPGLAVVLVGDNAASQTYVAAKAKAAAEVGIRAQDLRHSADVSSAELEDEIDRLNADHSVHGILVQLPLPKHINPDTITERIDPAKDVDGFHPANLGRLMLGRPLVEACTPAGVVALLAKYNVPLEGAHVVIIGRSTIVGKPLALMLAAKAPGRNATVTICHSRTKNLAEVVRSGDIVVAAAGAPELVTADMVAPGAVVVDVGTNRVADPSKKRGYRLVGDVKFEDVASKASLLTPVPGGIGPLTVAMLLQNTVTAWERAVDGHE